MAGTLDRAKAIVRSADAEQRPDGFIYSISGPVVVADKMAGAMMNELVQVGNLKLVGEIIQLYRARATVQVYEDTSGLAVGEPVFRTRKPLTVELGPGLLESIYDGIQRPLSKIYHKSSDPVFIPRGLDAPSLDRDEEWTFHATVTGVGTTVSPGQVLGTIKGKNVVPLYLMVPPGVLGRITRIEPSGEQYHVEDSVVTIETPSGKTREIKLYHEWPIRRARPVTRKLPPSSPLLTGQRVLDALFPLYQGSAAAIPGAFGCGKTVISQALSKHSNSDVIVYVGCGERGNEMAEVLYEFPLQTYQDESGAEIDIIKRTVLVANTSNMPVAAREASIYAGITIAEYFRDLGKHVTILADSTSRWAEALREIGGRLEEMPAEGGYPAYLRTRLSAFYERAGLSVCLGGGLPGTTSKSRFGSVTIVGAVSPAGGDFSDPVAQATSTCVMTFWALDKKLAQRKHFPSVNYHNSKPKRIKDDRSTPAFYREGSYAGFLDYRQKILRLLHEEDAIQRIVQLAGRECLSDMQRMVLDVSRLIIEDFLQQNAFSEWDATCPFWKTFLMMQNICLFYDEAHKLLRLDNPPTWAFVRSRTAAIQVQLSQMKFQLPTEEIAGRTAYEAIAREIRTTFDAFEPATGAGDPGPA